MINKIGTNIEKTTYDIKDDIFINHYSYISINNDDINEIIKINTKKQHILFFLW